MNKTYIKNILKDIKNTKGKVVSIATMVGLAALVVVALTMTGPSMRKTLDKSMNTYGHPDVIVRSTYGLDYEDEEILKRDKDIEKINFIKTADLLDKETLIRVKAYNKDIPKSVITKGRVPQAKNEIILDRILADKYKIGDEISFSYVDNPKFDEEVMDNLDYEVVGFFRTSDYFMEDMRELSFTAKKELNGYAYVLDENFATDKFGEANITYKDTKDLDKTSPTYKKLLEEKKENIEEKIANRPEEVLKKIKEDASDDLDEAQAEIDDAKEELSDASKELKKARADLDQGYKDYEDGKKTYNDKITKSQNDLANAKNELITGQEEIDRGWSDYQTNLNAYNNKIDQGQKDLDAKENELARGEEELDKAQADLNAGYKKLEEEFKGPKADLSASKIKLDQAKDELEEKEKQILLLEDQADEITNQDLAAMKAELAEGWADYESGLVEYNNNKQALDNRFASEKAKIDQGQNEINNKKADLNQGWTSFNQAKNEFQAQKNDGWNKLEAGKNEINQNQAKIDAGWSDYNKGLAELENQKKAGKIDLEEAYKKLLDGEEEYQKNLEKFNKEKPNALDEISEGEDDIKENKEALLKLVDPEYDVETIFDNEGINLSLIHI